MDIERIEEIAKNDMNADGISEYELAITHAKGSNVWTVKATTKINGNEDEIMLYIDDVSGKILKKVRHKNITANLHENIQVSDSVSYSLGMYFELTEEMYCNHTCTSSEEIILHYDDNELGLVTGFTINCKSEKDKVNALRIASNIISYITLKTGRFVYFKTPREVVNGQVEPVHAESKDIKLNEALDFTNSVFNNLISNDSKKSQSIAHFASGIKFIEAHSYEQAIREFFLVIENSGLPEENKYGPLRNAVSHEKLDKVRTIQGLSNFNIQINRGGYLDVTDPHIREILKIEAENLRRIADNYISSIL